MHMLDCKLLSECESAFEWMMAGIKASLWPWGLKHWMEASAAGWMKLDEKWWGNLLWIVREVSVEL